MPFYSRLRRIARRYLPAEAAGTVAAGAGAWVAYRLSGSAYVAALSGSISEAVGYYGVILLDEARRSRTPGVGAARTVAKLVPAVLVEFGPAELLDTLVVRPLLMAAGPALTGSVVGGTLAGKCGADVVFYAVVLPSGWVRSRLWTYRAVPPAPRALSAGPVPRPRAENLEEDCESDGYL
jgi:hypothetical protein